MSHNLNRLLGEPGGHLNELFDAVGDQVVLKGFQGLFSLAGNSKNHWLLGEIADFVGIRYTV